MRDRPGVLVLVMPLACVAAWGIPWLAPPRTLMSPVSARCPRPTGRAARRPRRDGLDSGHETQAAEPAGQEGPRMAGGASTSRRRVGPGEVSGRCIRTDSGTPDVANTSIACLALIRSGSTPRRGRTAARSSREWSLSALSLNRIEPEALADPGFSKVLVQRNLGPYIDSYLACLLLAEVKGRMSSRASEAIVEGALDKLIGKIELHVLQDDPFGSPAWTRGLSESVAKGTPMPPVPVDLAGWEPALPNALCGRPQSCTPAGQVCPVSLLLAWRTRHDRLTRMWPG